jgi:DNA-binding CsgD family transcriptional regulator/tetratricopeptide (TPR) repeat protein
VQAAFLARAAELSEDRPLRAARFLGAAAAALLGGEYARAQALVNQAEPDMPGVFDRARALRIRGLALSALGNTADATAVLASSARALEPFDVALAGDTWLDALGTAFNALGCSRGTSLADVARGALALSAAAAPAREDTLDTVLLRGLATRVAVGHAEAAPILRQALTSAADLSRLPDSIAIRSMFVSQAALELWDADSGMRLLGILAERDRRRGAMHDLRVALQGLACLHAWAGDFRAADALYEDGSQITRFIGADPLWDMDNLQARALRGQDDQVRASAKAIAELAEAHGLGAARAICRVSFVMLDVSRGRYQEALASAMPLYDEDPPGYGSQVLPDLVEAAAGTGDREAATAALRRLTERASAAGTPWALGLLARSAALLAAGDEPDARFIEAQHHLRVAGMRLDEARAHLLHGTWLRTRQRQADAAGHLRTAHDMFTAMGAEGYAERARRELQAAGAWTARPSAIPAPGTRSAESLTAQEEQVAALAARGLTNGEIAAGLFISASTVDYHLRKVFRKLGVTSRRQLARHVVRPDSRTTRFT